MVKRWLDVLLLIAIGPWVVLAAATAVLLLRDLWISYKTPVRDDADGWRE